MFWRKHSKMLVNGGWKPTAVWCSSVLTVVSHGGRGEAEWRRLSHPREGTILAPPRTLTFQPLCIRHDLNINSFSNIGCIFFGKFWSDFMGVAWNLFAIISLFLPSPPRCSFVLSCPASVCSSVPHTECVVRWSDRKAFGHCLCSHTKLSNRDHTISH